MAGCAHRLHYNNDLLSTWLAIPHPNSSVEEDSILPELRDEVLPSRHFAEESRNLSVDFIVFSIVVWSIQSRAHNR